jgi:hypothetical protein
MPALYTKNVGCATKTVGYSLYLARAHAADTSSAPAPRATTEQA